jgi:hypothetical protein
MEQLGYPPGRFRLPVSTGLNLQRQNLTVLFFSGTGSNCPCRNEPRMNLLTLVRSLLSLTWSNGNQTRKGSAPIPLFTNRSRQTAPSYCYYDRSVSFAAAGAASLRNPDLFPSGFSASLSQTSSYQVDPVASSEDSAAGPVGSWWCSSRNTPSLRPLVSLLFKDGSFRILTF